jgi:hypothetical protein
VEVWAVFVPKNLPIAATEKEHAVRLTSLPGVRVLIAF